MRIVIIIPTYNERASIKALLETCVRSVFPKIAHEMRILVVDGNSPDGTAESVSKLAATHREIFLLKERKKRGIGAAYAAGIRHAIEILHADAIVEFDGDGQHNPADIPRLISEFDKGFDLVIGSRYVQGGSIPKEWAFWRKALSRFGGLFAKAVLHLPTNDNTSGFKLTRVKGFGEHLPLEEPYLLSRYYAYKIQFLHELIRRKARVAEIPIAFRERQNGTSKNTMRDILDSLRIVLQLRFAKPLPARE
ncbi:MAG: polyprenol monophosphomannose synthase [bacterium]|nr:polyprenol monophosphomannose synthase [bacterium]